MEFTSSFFSFEFDQFIQKIELNLYHSFIHQTTSISIIFLILLNLQTHFSSMQNHSFCLTRKILVYQKIYWNKELFLKKTILVRSELNDQRNISKCPVIFLEKFGKCHIIGYAQCRRDAINPNDITKKTVLSDIFKIHSLTSQNEYWIHQRFLLNESDSLINQLLNLKNLFKVYDGMESIIAKPKVERPQQFPPMKQKEIDSLVPQKVASQMMNQMKHQMNQNQKSEMKSLKPIAQLNDLYDSKQFTQKIPRTQILPSLFDGSKNSSKLNPSTNQLKSSLSLNDLKSIFTIGFECHHKITTVRLIAQSLFGELTSFPRQLETTDEILHFQNEILTKIEQLFIKQIARFLNSLLQFAIQLGYVRKFWNDRETNLMLIQHYINEVRKHFSRIEFCLSLPFREFISEIIIYSSHQSFQFDFIEHYTSMKELFLWNDNSLKKVIELF